MSTAPPVTVDHHLGQHASAVAQALERADREALTTRIWARDPTIWAPKGTPEITNRLGWLTLPESQRGVARDLQELASLAREEQVAHLVVLGMGGSSLSPEVFSRTFGSAPGFPALELVDTTHPLAVRVARKRLDLSRCWFVVSSKSGTTLETLSLFRYFWKETGAVDDRPGQRFLAVTDPGTPLEALGKKRKFRQVVLSPPDVGGRFSALTPFGLLPAACLGADLPGLLDRAGAMAQACGPGVAAHTNPGLVFGTILGTLGRRGVDKITIVASPTLESFPIWAEQLLAESTGKNGRGLVPIAGEPLRVPEAYGRDRCFVYLHVDGDASPPEALSAIEAAGCPIVRLAVKDRLALGAEFFRWEFAIACAGPLLGIHPFDQPDVEFAKELARQAMSGRGQGRTGGPLAKPTERGKFQSWSAGAHEPMYAAVQAYVEPSPAMDARLNALRDRLWDILRVPVMIGYGPRYLHSTGQLQKGGPSTDLCLQLVDRPSAKVPVPETEYSFGQLIRAQADGDAEALEERGRRVLRIDLGARAPSGLDALSQMLEGFLHAVPS